MPPNQELITSAVGALRDKDVVYLRNRSNLGDALIAEGTFQLFECTGLRLSSIGPNVDPTGKTVVVRGGGNFVGFYSFLRAAIYKWRNRLEELIVLPHSIEDSQEVLEGVGENATVICCQPCSYQ